MIRWLLGITALLLCWLLTRLRVSLSTLSATLTAQLSWTATKTLTGTAYSAITNQSAIKKALSLGTSAANAAVGGADELASFVTSVSASSSSSIDLTAMTDILNQSSASLARAKAIVIRLLSASDDATNGTAAASITLDNTVTNALSAQSHSGWFDNAHEGTATGGMGDATGSKFTIPNGGFLAFGTPAAAGVLVDGTHKVVKITNNDGAIAAKAETSFVGGST